MNKLIRKPHMKWNFFYKIYKHINIDYIYIYIKVEAPNV